MATIRIDDSKPFPVIPGQPDNRRESAQDFFKRQAAGLKLISDEMEQENNEQEEMRKLQEKSFERKKKLLFDNLDLITVRWSLAHFKSVQHSRQYRQGQSQACDTPARLGN